MEELCERIKFKKQSIYNKIHKGELTEGTHFLKPSRRKLLFRWSAMKVWLGDTQPGATESAKNHTSWNGHPDRPGRERQPILRSAINI
jgi:hypothetical protein